MVVEPLIVGLLLLAGLMHASWNALLKSDTADRLTTFGVIMTTGTAMGLVAVPFLPGDSLLFASGALWASAAMPVELLGLTLVVAAFCGDNCNYWIGRRK